MQSTPAIIDKHYEFLKWLKQHVGKFPKHERGGFGHRIVDKCLDVLEKLIAACYQKDKAELLRGANLDLEVLRYFLRLCKDDGLLNIKQYQYAMERLLDIGQQLGGWIKQQSKPA